MRNRLVSQVLFDLFRAGGQIDRGGRYFDYDCRRYLIFTVDLQVTFQVEEASKEEPYFGFRLGLDPALAASVVTQNPVELPSIMLRPNETVDVNLAPLRQAAAARSDLNAVSVNVVNSGAPGSLIGAWYGVDTTKLLTYDVPLRDSGPIRNSTGSYPWRTDQDYTTIVNITNISDHAASFVADIRFPDGHYFVPTLELPAGGTARFDLRKIISEQRPDNQGNVR